MFTNKHVVVAMLVAPVLAILAWFAIDYFLAERPHAAQPGDSYKLIARSNCRYASGQCDLANGDFELNLKPTALSPAALTLSMRSRFPLQQATIGFIGESAQASPSKMTSGDERATSWSATLAIPQGDATTLGLVVSSQGAEYFAEIPTAFLELDP